MVTDNDIKRFKKITEVKFCISCKKTGCCGRKTMNQSCEKYTKRVD